jgi:hypothetical protein
MEYFRIKPSSSATGGLVALGGIMTGPDWTDIPFHRGQGWEELGWWWPGDGIMLLAGLAAVIEPALARGRIHRQHDFQSLITL